MGLPNIIIPYPAAEDGFVDCADLAAYAVAYVRPETNNVLYERAILAGLRAHGKIIYCANIPGEVFLQDKILQNHYPCQFRLARDPRGELARLPEVRARVEEHFRLSLDDARLIGSFEAVHALGMSEEELFETIVPGSDYLGCWGQSFKRLAGAIVVNPNLPAIVKRHAPPANVFAVVVRAQGYNGSFFEGVNEAIFKEITSRSETPVIDGEKLDSLVWSEKIRRTYHLSSNHLMAMFDMPDYVYTASGARLSPAETPLGKWLLHARALTPEALQAMKSSPLMRRRDSTLLYVPGAGRGMRLEQISALVADLPLSSAGGGQGTTPGGAPA
ncbi:MAG: hypothetical protein ACLQCB_05385 [Spirochaetia bacterium]